MGIKLRNPTITSVPVYNRSKTVLAWHDLESNNTERRYPEKKCIHQLFEEQVLLSPESIAVMLYQFNDHFSRAAFSQLTFHELNKQANRFANYLISNGITTGSVVAICINRSIEMMIAILGILKAGAAYLPLDPSYPKVRFDFILKDSEVSLVVSQKSLNDKFTDQKIKITYIDDFEKEMAGKASSNPRTSVQSSDLAYIIYTSGSTGTPKGTLIPHRSVVNYLWWAKDFYKVEDGAGAPVNSSMAFDATVTSLFTPLIVGKPVILLPEVDELGALTDALSNHKHFSLVKITPSHLQILEQLLAARELDGQVNALVIGGEALRLNHIKFWLGNAPGTRIINEYGPTETVVGCSVYEFRIGKTMQKNIPIGKPIANTKIYILDEKLQPVENGMPGEIFITGAGVGLGYLNRPELTAERFIPNHLSGELYPILYRSGDLGYHDEDGNIVYIGRVDQQVKVHGYRIELGEIEAVLLAHPQIKNAVVISREDIYDDICLVAYMVLETKAELATQYIRRYLMERLPIYMIPVAFVFIDLIPLTSNGKVDRDALPKPVFHRDDLAQPYCEAVSKTQLKLKRIYEDLLKISPIGIHDDFFQSGGNSIIAAMLIRRIRQEFGKKLPLSVMIKASTIAELERVIKAKETGSTSSLIAIQPNGNKPALYCIHGGWGHVLFYRNLSKYLGNDQPLYALQALGLNGKEQPLRRMEDMAAYYITQIKKVQPKGPYNFAGYCFGAIVAFEMARQLMSMGEETTYLASFNGLAPVYELKKANKYRQQLMQSNHRSALSKFYNKLRQIKHRIPPYLYTASYQMKSGVRNALCSVIKILNLDIPDSLRRMHVVDGIVEAQLKYKPGTYPGKMKIFRSPKIYMTPYLGWSALVTGGIKTFDVPGDHANRTVIMYDPFVKIVAEEVEKDLANLKTGSA